MSDYSLGLAQDEWDRPMCDRCGDLTDHLSPDGLCDRCQLKQDIDAEEHEHGDLELVGPTPAGAAVVIATIVALLVAGVLVAWRARPFDGAHLILSPLLILAGAGLLARFVHVARHREVHRG